MIEELILKEREKSEHIINEYETNIKRLEKLKIKKEALMDSIKPYYNGFGGAFKVDVSGLSQKEKEEKIIATTKKVEDVKKEIEDLEQEINELNEKTLKIDIDAIKQKLIDLQDKKKATEVLLSEDMSLAENIQFMKEAIDVDREFITYDKTDNPDIYIKVLEKEKDEYVCKISDDENYKKEEEKGYRESIDKIIEEIRNPKAVPDDKYKIPTKYIFEAVRERIGGLIRCYSKYDGEFPKEYGKQLQKMWEDEDSIFTVHSVGRNYNSLTDKQMESDKVFSEKSVQSIFRQGLKATNSMGELEGLNNNPKLEATTYSKGAKGFCFLEALDYTYAGGYGFMLIQVPKKGVGKDADIAIWGTKTKDENRSGKVFLLPKYIKGFVENNRQVDRSKYYIRENDCKEKEEYPYFLMDASYKTKGEVLETEKRKQEITIKDIAEADKETKLTTREVRSIGQILEKINDKEKSK